MFLYLIRHGHPDYKTDSLLPDGKEQAKLVAKRMVKSGLDCIYASSMGRAVETAQPTAEALGLPINVVDWARELDKRSHSPFPDGTPKLLSGMPKTYLVNEAFRSIPSGREIGEIPGLCDSRFSEQYRIICDGIDGMLREHGYSRNERGFYDITNYSEEHIGVFCHNGMGRVVISHLLNIPYQYLASVFSNHYTGVTIFYFDDGNRHLDLNEEYLKEQDEKTRAAADVVRANIAHIAKTGLPETAPYLVSYGDIGHLYNESEGLEYFVSKTKM